MTRPGKSQRKATSSSGKSPVADESPAVKPVTVPFSATPRGELPEISDWAQPLVFDNTFHDRNFGFRHGRGCHHALECVEQLLSDEYVFVVDADLKSYFDTIPKDRLMQLVQQSISDRRVLGLIQKYLDQNIMDGRHEWTPESGVPQGAVLSPVLSNVYLNPLDHLMAGQNFQMVRYADDFVVLCRTAEEASSALQAIQH